MMTTMGWRDCLMAYLPICPSRAVGVAAFFAAEVEALQWC
jgi:hypothetical protein